MDGKITGETDDLVGLSIIDTEGVEHVIDIKKEDGAVTAHKQDGYPNKTQDRTDHDLVRLSEVQAFAQYFVLTTEGYPTVEPQLVPEWLAFTLGAVFSLETETFERLFGEYGHQYRSSLREDIAPIVETPEDAAGGIVFRADVFTGLEFDEFLQATEEMDPFETVTGGTDDYETAAQLERAMTDHLAPGTEPIAEVSAVDVFYETQGSDGRVKENTIGQRSHTHDGPVDAQLQLTPPLGTIDQDLPPSSIQGLLVHHLACQIRDAHLRLGLEPPEPFRVLGQGLFRQTIRYQQTDVYPNYHLTDADIEGYRPPSVDLKPSVPSPLNVSRERPSLTTVLRRALFGQ